jgi:tail tube GTA-gp10-like protein
MANPHKGEVEFTVDRTAYTLSFSINAMCELENALGGNVVELAGMMADPSKMTFNKIRAVFWAGLLDHHDGIDEVAAGRIMKDVGFAAAAELIVKAFTVAFPEVQGSAPLAKGAKRASTGKAR